MDDLGGFHPLFSETPTSEQGICHSYSSEFPETQTFRPAALRPKFQVAEFELTKETNGWAATAPQKTYKTWAPRKGVVRSSSWNSIFFRAFS